MWVPFASVHEAATFGPRHHLTSLFRYALCAGAPGVVQRASAEPRTAAFDSRRRYRLGPHVRVLSDLRRALL